MSLSIYIVFASILIAATSSEPVKKLRRDEAFIGYSEGSKGIACRDKEGACADWASSGECEKNPKFMKESCPVSCNQCTPAELRVEDFLNENLVISTSLGDIRVQMLFENAPRSCALVLELAHQGECKHCNFYRPELAPSDGSSGPPYGLLQGSMVGILKSLPSEGKGIEVKYGHIATITGADFYIAAIDHPGWGSAHTVWGKVENMDVVEYIIKNLKYHEITHPSYGTKMRMADQVLPFVPMYKQDLSEL